jgi:dTDP-4-amino-4,6-dideoxygalactose transaminase
VVTRVPLVDLAAQDGAVEAEVLAAVATVAREARFVLGERVQAFEQWLAGATGASHAVGLASGTDALELSLRALGIGPGDAVITPAFSFVAAAEAIANAGARPVFCDIDAATSNLTRATCEEALARARRAGHRVRAVVPVHLFGRCAPLGPLGELAASEGLEIVEDAAQALGARDEGGSEAGSVGAAGCFSFFPTKNLGAWGDGGAMVTSRAELAARVRRLRAHGSTTPYLHEELGRNSRLDALQAAVLLAKSFHLERWQRSRARIAAGYLARLGGLPLALPPDARAPAVHAWHAFVVRSDRRDELAASLRDAGVDTRVYYPVPLHRQPCFEHLGEPPLPVAEEACRTALALPMFSAMTEAQQGHVVEHVLRYFEGRPEA